MGAILIAAALGGLAWLGTNFFNSWTQNVQAQQKGGGILSGFSWDRLLQILPLALIIPLMSSIAR